MIWSWPTRGQRCRSLRSPDSCVVRFAHTLRDELRGLTGADAAAAAAEQRRRQREQRGRLRPLRQPLPPRDHRLAHRLHQIRSSQLPFGAEPGDDHRRRSRQLPRVSVVCRVVDEDLMRAGRLGIEPALQRRAHRAADRAVHDRFGAGQLRRAVMADQQRLGDVGQIAIDDRDLQRGCRTGRTPRARRAGDARTSDSRCGGAPANSARAGRLRTRPDATGAPARAACAATGASRVVVPSFSSSRYASNASLRFGQRAVLAVERPGLHARQQRALQRHAAIALVRCVEVDQPVVAELVAAGVNAALPTTSSSFPAKARKILVALFVEMPPQRRPRASSTSWLGIPHCDWFSCSGSRCQTLFCASASRSPSASAFHLACLPRPSSRPAWSCSSPETAR